MRPTTSPWRSTTIATGIDLTIVKKDVPSGFDPIATSGTEVYTITVDNIGTQNASGIRGRDTLPAGATFSATSGQRTSPALIASGIVECVGGSIRGTYWETT